MRRILEPEILDSLPADDPLAVGSRADLRRVNSLMGNSSLCQTAIEHMLQGRAPTRLVELGCGDGEFMAGIARGSPKSWCGVEVWLVDRIPAVREPTLKAFAAAGWSPRVATADVFAWLAESPRIDVCVANLFLHHFEERQLAALLEKIAARSSALVACEPRRSPSALWASHALGLVGCNRVTRHDAAVSVRAGFADRELSALWPDPASWEMSEESSGLFSHLFTARRRSAADGSRR